MNIQGKYDEKLKMIEHTGSPKTETHPNLLHRQKSLIAALEEDSSFHSVLAAKGKESASLPGSMLPSEEGENEFTDSPSFLRCDGQNKKTKKRRWFSFGRKKN